MAKRHSDVTAAAAVVVGAAICWRQFESAPVTARAAHCPNSNRMRTRSLDAAGWLLPTAAIAAAAADGRIDADFEVVGLRVMLQIETLLAGRLARRAERKGGFSNAWQSVFDLCGNELRDLFLD